MPSKYPVLSSHEVVKILEENGFICVAQKGSHKKMKNKCNTVIIPMHSEIAKGTLKSIINQSGLRLEDFLKK